MDSSKINIITNVFISAGNNNVRLAEIFYNDSILEVRFVSNPINWNEIKDNTSRNKFTGMYKSSISQSQNVINGEFNLLIPGGIDSHVHFNTPGFEEREDFQHASNAAAVGGVTTVIDMPCTSLPPVTSKENLDNKLKHLKGKSVVDFAMWGGVSGNDFKLNKEINKQILELSDAGVVGFKAYLISGMKSFEDLTIEQMKIIAGYIAKINKPLGVHAEDKFLVESRRVQFRKRKENNWEHYCKARDILAEEKAVEEMLAIAKETNVKIHIVHLSSKRGLELISKAKLEGLSVTSETCPHYLYFTQDDFRNKKISNFLKTAPPVKFKEDKDALWEGIRDGTLSFVVTDHAGSIPARDKSSQNFWEIYGGIPGAEHRVPFLFSEGFLKEKLTLEQTIKLLSTNTAAFFGLERKGNLEVGFDSDFALINLWNSEIVSSANMHSKGKYTPFEGIKFNAVVEKTWLRGKIVADKKNEVTANYNGKFIPVINRHN